MKLEPYLERIHYQGAPGADLRTLTDIHYLHPAAIAFENLSTLLGEPVPLDLEALEDKLVRRRRGGYCFEHNLLLRHVLETLGFHCTPLAARVVWNRADAPPGPRTHMAMLVDLDGRRYLCDVGFGGVTLTAPLELVPDREQSTPHEPYRLLELEREYELQIRFAKEWRPVYRFDLQPQLAIDYEPVNHYVATHPSSIFRKLLMAGRTEGAGRYALAGNQFARYEQGKRTIQQTIDSGSRLRVLLEQEFAIDTTSLPASFDSLLTRIAESPG